MHKLFADEGIEVITNARISRVEGKSGQSVRLLTFRADAKVTTGGTLDGTHLLVASGRTPNTKGIGLDLAGVELTDRGYIKVNERGNIGARRVGGGRLCRQPALHSYF